MRELIVRTLRDIEKEYNVKVLLAVESGKIKCTHLMSDV